MEKRMKNSNAAICSTLLFATLFCGSAFGQAYPSKPIKVTTVSQGGALDTVLRLIGQGISGPLGQQVIVDNKPSSIYPEDSIAKGTPDGYSLGYFANAIWLAPFLRANLPHDPLKDFSPISLTVKGPNVIAITPSLGVNTLSELVALAKSKPGVLNIGVTGVGTSPTNAADLFQALAGTKMTVVRYKGTAQAFLDVVAGRVQVITPTILSVLPLAKVGKIKLLAVTSEQASALMPDLPTVASAGYPDYEAVAIQALLAPPRTPTAIINRLNEEVTKFLLKADTKAKIVNMGFDVMASSPAQLSATMKSEMDKMGPVFRDAGIKPGDASD